MEAIEKYVEEIREAEKKYWSEMNFDQTKVPEFTIKKGKKFAKIVIRSYDQLSVHCFVEMSTGDIYKAASWSAPAKGGVRGNVNSEKKPLLGYDFYNKY